MGAEELLDGFMKIAAVAYFSVLCGWFGRELIGGFIVGRRERKELKERARTWKTAAKAAAVKSGQPALPVSDGRDVALDPL